MTRDRLLMRWKDARISQRDQKVLATLYDSRRLDWNDPIEVKRSMLSKPLKFLSDPFVRPSICVLIFRHAFALGMLWLLSELLKSSESVLLLIAACCLSLLPSPCFENLFQGLESFIALPQIATLIELISLNYSLPKKSVSVLALILISFLLLAAGIGGAIKGLQTRITLERRKMLINSYLLSNNDRILRRTAITPDDYEDLA